MKVAYINYYFDKDITYETYFTMYPSIQGWCKAVSDAGISVTVYQRFNNNQVFRKDNVSYNLVQDNKDGNLSLWSNPVIFHKEILKEDFDIIHINGFNYSFQAFLLKTKTKTSRIIIQHHAEKPWRGIKKYIQEFFLRHIDGVIFSSGEILKEWINNRVINSEIVFEEIIENSTNFIPGDKMVARGKTGITGNPVFLWVGRLNENKDPLTVISGFQILLNEYHEAKLYMIYSENDLELKVIKCINSSKYLKESIKLLGKIEHKLLNNFYNSADYLVLGSHYESSGYSLIEAMACGVTPIVTEIPSFVTITQNGAAGGLWEAGNVNSFYETARNILMLNKEELSKRNVDIFNTELSFHAISRKAKNFYEKLLKT